MGWSGRGEARRETVQQAALLMDGWEWLRHLLTASRAGHASGVAILPSWMIAVSVKEYDEGVGDVSCFVRTSTTSSTRNSG